MIWFLEWRLFEQGRIKELVSLDWTGAVVRGRIENIGGEEKLVILQEVLVNWDGWSSQAACKRVKKLTTKTSLLSEVWVRVGLLIHIAMVVVCVSFFDVKELGADWNYCWLYVKIAGVPGFVCVVLVNRCVKSNKKNLKTSRRDARVPGFDLKN